MALLSGVVIGLSRSTQPTPRRVCGNRFSPVSILRRRWDIGLDDVDVAAEIVVPHVVEDLGLLSTVPALMTK